MRDSSTISVNASDKDVRSLPVELLEFKYFRAEDVMFNLDSKGAFVKIEQNRAAIMQHKMLKR